MSSQTVPSEAYGLGEPLGEFDFHSAITSRGGFVVVLITLGLSGLGYGVYSFEVNKEGLAFFTVIIALMGLCCVSVGGALAVQNYREGDWVVQAFEEGMLLTRKTENKVLRWRDIESVARNAIFTLSFGENEGIPIATYYTYKVQMQDGEKYTFNGPEAERLGNLIQEEVSKHRFSRAAEIPNS